MMTEIIITSDGSHTLYVPELNEHYHSIHGAMQESEHIFIRAGFDFCSEDPLDILEIGFGTGLNALLTALHATAKNRRVNYTTIEKFPLEKKIINSLNYGDMSGPGARDVFLKIHDAPWGTVNKITDHFSILKINADMTLLPLLPVVCLVYFDAFGPDKQPEMWTSEIFNLISAAMKQGGTFVTYSAKGEVKRNLRSAGFRVELLPGPPGKREIIRANKI
jgi:tRNA U34 5-methylaminomethyl-2-thiouridine-forming methyltransferase MnmC